MSRPDILWAIATGASGFQIDEDLRAELHWPIGEPTRGPDAFRLLPRAWQVQSIVRVRDEPRTWKVVLTHDWPEPSDANWARRLASDEPVIPAGRLVEFSAPGEMPWPAIVGACLMAMGWSLS